MADYQQNGVSLFDLAETQANQSLGTNSYFSSHYQLNETALTNIAATYRFKQRPPVSVYSWSLGVDADYSDPSYSMFNDVCVKGRYPCDNAQYTVFSGSVRITKNPTGEMVANGTVFLASDRKVSALIVSLQGGGGGSGGSNGSSASSGGGSGGSGLVVIVFDNSSSFDMVVGSGGSGGNAGSGGNCTDGNPGYATRIESVSSPKSYARADGGSGGPSAWVGNSAAGAEGVELSGSPGSIYRYAHMKGGDGQARTVHGGHGEPSTWITTTSPAAGTSSNKAVVR